MLWCDNTLYLTLLKPANIQGLDRNHSLDCVTACSNSLSRMYVLNMSLHEMNAAWLFFFSTVKKFTTDTNKRDMNDIAVVWLLELPDRERKLQTTPACFPPVEFGCDVPWGHASGDKLTKATLWEQIV